MPRIVPFLWFDDQAEEAARFYTSVFERSRILEISRYGEAGPGTPGTVMTVTFELDGLEVTALNGGPEFKPTEAFSLQVHCESQDEVDELWKRLSDGGEEGPCGWLKDRFGLSWQVVPRALLRMLQDDDPEKATRVMQAMLRMKKVELRELERAYEGS